MSYRVVKVSDLMAYEFSKIEGAYKRLRPSDIEKVLPQGMSVQTFNEKLHDGQLLLLSDSPLVPALESSKGNMGVVSWKMSTAANDSFSPQARTALLSRTKSNGFASRSSGNLHPPLPMAPYSPEPVKAEPPSPPPEPLKISPNFGKPAQADKVFAKSCTRPYGDTQACDAELKAANFGQFATFVPANAVAMNGTRQLGTLTGTASRMPLNWSVAGELAKSTISRANFLLLAFWPSPLGDGTIFSHEELSQLPEAKTRVRFRLYQDENGKPQVVGIHTGEGGAYGDTVRVIKTIEEAGSYKAVVDDDLVLIWETPDGSDVELIDKTIFPDTSGLEVNSILVRPIEDDAQEIDSLVYPNPEAEHVELIVTFPTPDIAPLYLVFSRPKKPKVKPLEVGTYGDLAPRSKKDGMDIDHIPSQAALIKAAERMAGRPLLATEKAELINSAAGVAIPNEVHRKCSETYGFRNNQDKQIEDAGDLKTAVDSNFDAIKRCLLDNGYSEQQLEEARNKLHDINKANGWY